MISHVVTLVLALVFVVFSSLNSPESQMICDSGAWPHMFNDKALFTSLKPWSTSYPKQTVELAAKGAEVPICGVGTAKRIVNNKHVMASCLYSIPEHLRYQGCSQFAKGNEFLLTFPSCVVVANVRAEISCNIRPAK